jgi:hypothetical protein
MQRSSWLAWARWMSLVVAGDDKQRGRQRRVEQSSVCNGMCEEAKWKRRTLPCVHAQRDKAAMACGSVTTGSDRRRRPLCREGGHRLVTCSVVGGNRTGHRLLWSKPVLGHGLWARPS